MIRRRDLISALAALLIATSATHAQRPDARPIRILLVGNSYTYGAHAPRMLPIMGQARGQTIEAVQHVTPAMSLAGHWSGTKSITPGADPTMTARDLIAKGGWDFVMLQDQSQMPLINPGATIEFGKKFCQFAAEHDAQPVFFLTWARANAPDTQPKITETYIAAARAGGGAVSPVGLAFQAAFKADTNLTLHQNDGSHANREGGYLTACVWYAVLTGQSPVGLPGKLTYSKGPRHIGIVCDIPPARARFLQTIAWETVEQFRKDHADVAMIAREAAAEGD